MAYLRHGFWGSDAVMWIILAVAVAVIGGQFLLLSYVLLNG